MREEIASIILEEIETLIKRLERLDQHINQQLPKTLEKVSADVLERQLLLKVRFELQELSQELTEQYSQKITDAFAQKLDQQYEKIKTWEHQVLNCLELSRRNYGYLAALALGSGLVGAFFSCLFFVLFWR
jgi:exonuclease V gamma subunit